MARFRLLAGKHVQADLKAEPVKVVGNDGREYEKYPSKVYVKGDIVESDDDLVTMLGPDKFQLLGGPRPKNRPKVLQPVVKSAPVEDDLPPEDEDAVDDVVEETTDEQGESHEPEGEDTEEVADDNAEDEEPAEDVEETPQTPDAATLRRMTLREVRNYAKARDIDISKAKNKDEAIHLITRSRKHK